MRLVTFRTADGARAGAVENGGIVELAARLGVASTKALLAANRLGEAARAAAGAAVDFAFDDVALDLPITDPAKILCVGVNYENRNAEYRDNSEVPQYPSLFMRTPLSFVPYGQPAEIPPESEQLDYEGAIVIGTPGRRIRRADARAPIAGLTIMNEGTIRTDRPRRGPPTGQAER